jgi:hypothetical protein
MLIAGLVGTASGVVCASQAGGSPAGADPAHVSERSFRELATLDFDPLAHFPSSEGVQQSDALAAVTPHGSTISLGMLQDAGAAESGGGSDLAKAAQNPIADMISLPFQYNLNFNVGPDNDPQHILNIQPVYPINLSDEWNLITRTIIPLIQQPSLFPGDDDDFGLGDIQFTGFFSPAMMVVPMSTSSSSSPLSITTSMTDGI